MVTKTVTYNVLKLSSYEFSKKTNEKLYYLTFSQHTK